MENNTKKNDPDEIIVWIVVAVVIVLVICLAFHFGVPTNITNTTTQGIRFTTQVSFDLLPCSLAAWYTLPPR